MFGTVQAKFGKAVKLSSFAAVLTMACVFGQASETGPASILAIEDVQEVSLVTLTGGYEQGFRNGMKLLTHGENGITAELIVLDVTEHETQTLITDILGQSPLQVGNPVTIKTINFAATWK